LVGGSKRGDRKLDENKPHKATPRLIGSLPTGRATARKARKHVIEAPFEGSPIEVTEREN